jgi:phage/plasmid-like protein (TIGR03299 family)
MAHAIESTAYAGAVPWHGLGKQADEDDCQDWQRFLVKAGLNWEVKKVPLVTRDRREAVERYAVRRTSDGKLLGDVGPRFTLLQNKDAFRWFVPFVEAGEALLHTAGSLKGGSRVWVLAKLNRDPLRIAPGDEVDKFVLLSHAHDGSLAVRVGFTPVRVVCQNTLALAHGSDASRLIRVRHTKGLHESLENIREVMNLANQEFEATAEQYRKLVRKEINQKDLEKYIKIVFKVPEDEKPTTRIWNQMQQVIRLFEEGKGNNLPGVRGTAWAMYNSMTEFLSFHRGPNADRRLDSLWFGDGARMNETALSAALSMAL